MKRIVLIIVFISILIGIPVTVFLVSKNQEIRQRAAPATTLTLTPSSATKQVGDEFVLDVSMNTATNQVVAVQVSLSFDPTKLEAEWIHNGTMFPNIISSGVIGNGSASIALGAANTTTPITGTGVAASVKFKALAATTAPISVKFSADTFVGALGEGSTNVLTSTVPSTITITTGTAPTLTPTPTTGGSSTITPTATPTGGAGTTLTPTPTGTSNATPSAITITSPTANESIVSQTPTIQGKAPAGSTVTIAVYSTQQITATVTADANGNWSYVVPQALDAGSHTVVVAAQNPTTGQTETATLAFVISNGTTTTTTSETGEAMPVSGSIEPTILLIGLGVLLLIGGAAIPVLTSK